MNRTQQDLFVYLDTYRTVSDKCEAVIVMGVRVDSGQVNRTMMHTFPVRRVWK